MNLGFCKLYICEGLKCQMSYCYPMLPIHGTFTINHCFTRVSGSITLVWSSINIKLIIGLGDGGGGGEDGGQVEWMGGSGVGRGL